MSRERPTLRCDLCRFVTGPPEDFTLRAGFDLCRWCSEDYRNARWIETGTHRVTFHGPDEAWACSCGQTYNDVVMALRLNGWSLQVLDAAPNLIQATASIHLTDIPGARLPSWHR